MRRKRRRPRAAVVCGGGQLYVITRRIGGGAAQPTRYAPLEESTVRLAATLGRHTMRPRRGTQRPQSTQRVSWLCGLCKLCVQEMSSCRSTRNGNRKTCPAAGAVLRAHGAAVELYQMLDDGEAETGAARIAGARLVH